LIEAWSPLGTGKMLNDPTLLEIASNYNVSVAQLCIRWCLQNGTLPLPKSVTPERIKQNLNVYHFEISESDMKRIDTLPYIGGSGLLPDEVAF
jgi:diketogulonate reductase-like aldo/keto reductase